MSDPDNDREPTPVTAAEWLAAVRQCERAGELFRAFDLARQGLEHFPDELRLKHRAVLCLASTGATRRALQLFNVLALDKHEDVRLTTSLGLDIAALRPRLLKDAALGASGAERARMLSAAAAGYTEVYRQAIEAGNPEAYYPGVNAATLHLLAGNDDEAAAIARAVLDELAQRPAQDKPYYEIVSELEAQLVLGDLAGARRNAETVRNAIRENAEKDYRGMSSTVRQLRLIVAAKSLDTDWLNELAPPPVIHYIGHIVAPPGKEGRFPNHQVERVKAEIAELLDTADVRFGYGSLAAGADILFAEALLARGAGLHAILPFDRDEFIETSVRPSGADWVERFHACLARATTVRYATEDRYLGDDHLFGYCSQLGMGLALLHARHLSAGAEQLIVWDGKPPAGPVGTAVDMRAWQRTGMPQRIISVGDGYDPLWHEGERRIERQTRAMLFGDVKGFSKLNDEQLPRFVDAVLGAFARLIRRYRADIRFSNTWGDGLFLVFDDAAVAADCALTLQDAVSRVDRARHNLPADLSLRIGIHLGPVYAARDPILLRHNFFGAHVSRAARIEPVTPEGSVYVTETMAAVLALHNADQFTCEYVGMTEAAKQYGAMRMFLLGRRSH